jgi:hypothetical protein
MVLTSHLQHIKEFIGNKIYNALINWYKKPHLPWESIGWSVLISIDEDYPIHLQYTQASSQKIRFDLGSSLKIRTSPRRLPYLCKVQSMIWGGGILGRKCNCECVRQFTAVNTLIKWAAPLQTGRIEKTCLAPSLILFGPVDRVHFPLQSALYPAEKV